MEAKLIANELRIGNFLQAEWDNKYTAEVTAFNGSSVWVDLYGDLEEDLSRYLELDYDFLSPIPLTEEWLLKLDEALWEFVGFGTRSIYQHTVLSNLKLEYAQGQVYFYFKDEMIAAKNFVHEAQNLFYSLTNQELW